MTSPKEDQQPMTHEPLEALKPCPFCNSTRLECGGDDKFVGVRCLDCEATGPNHYNTGKDWNTRALTASPGEQEPVVEGYVLVPVEPTLKIIRAMHHKIDWCRDDQNTYEVEHPSQNPNGVGTTCKQDICDAYRAMIDAIRREAPAPDGVSTPSAAAESNASVEARLREALEVSGDALDEYYRYWTGGESRGSYDGRPERDNLWKAMYAVRAARKALSAGGDEAKKSEGRTDEAKARADAVASGSASHENHGSQIQTGVGSERSSPSDPTAERRSFVRQLVDDPNSASGKSLQDVEVRRSSPTAERRENARSPMQRLLDAAGWDAGSTRHKQLEDALDGARLRIVAAEGSADRRETVARIKADPGDGTLHPDLAHVLARGFDTMGWDRPASAAEDMIDAILAALDGGAGE